MLSRKKVKPGARESVYSKNTESEPDIDVPTSKGSILPTDEFFRCDIETCLKCISCGYSRYVGYNLSTITRHVPSSGSITNASHFRRKRTEIFRHLSVCVEDHALENKPISLQQSLESFFKPDEVEIKCEKCSKGLKAMQTMKLVNR